MIVSVGAVGNLFFIVPNIEITASPKDCSYGMLYAVLMAYD
jgi:hypothetical protein